VENLVEFHLLYSRPLHSGRHHGPRQEKHAIRKVFHSQLRRLWDTHPNLRKLAEREGREAYAVEIATPAFLAKHPTPPTLRDNLAVQMGLKRLGAKWSRGGFNFLPLVTTELCLRCSLDILFLRAEEKNYILQGGDIDGRLKTLFDALRIADRNELPPRVSPDANEDPFFCLLQDDTLISEVRVNTDQLLRLPEPKTVDQHDVYLQITVRLGTTQNTGYSWVY
jgi:hypothetical protein